MNESSIRARGKTRTPSGQRMITIALALFVLLAVTVGAAFAAMPPAGAVIGNKATATFTDPALGAQSVDSNTVTTTVQQVYSLNMTQPLTLNGAAGGPVNFPLTLTNTGNGSESYTLAVTAGFTNPPLTGVTLYPNVAGAPGSTPISSPITLTSGQVYSFFAVANVSGAASAGNIGTFHVTATDAAHSPTGTNDVLDTVTVTGNALITITKTVNPTSGNPNDTVTYNLAYANSGNNTATSFSITDTVPGNLTYVANSAKLNGVALADTTINNPQTTGKLIVPVGSVPSSGAGSSGNLTFQVKINASAPSGTIGNTATFTYNDGSGATIGPVNSTTANLTVNQAANVRLSDLTSTTDNGTIDDTVTVAGPATQGTVVWFDNVLTNTGNGTDSFNLSTSGSTFPAGTTIEIYNAAKTATITATPAVAAGTDYHVWTKVSLPLNYNGGTGGNNGGAGWSVTLTATSVFDGTKSDPVADKLGSITPAKVDITNGVALSATCVDTFPAQNACGAGIFATGEPLPVTTNTVNSGASTDFTLYINNTGPIPDTYTLTAGSTSGMAALPAGYSVVFLDGGSPVTTVNVTAGANKQIIARLSLTSAVAPTATPQDIFFKASSGTTNATDTKHDAVTVATSRSITINPASLNGPITIGGYAYYCHTITNNGNMTEGSGAGGSTITLGTADNAANFTSTVFYDANGNCAIDTGENTVATLPVIAPGASIKVVVKVFANTNVTSGSIDTTTLTVTTTGVINSIPAPAAVTALDTSTAVAPGGVSVIKSQALDANCDGTATAYGSGNLNAAPGQCVRYQITVTNNNPWTVTGINVTDATPTDSLAGLPTLYSGGGSSCYDASWVLKASLPVLGASQATVTGGSVNSVTTAPTTCSSGNFVFNVGNLASGATATITFGVQVPH